MRTLSAMGVNRLFHWPETENQTFTVPVSTGISERIEKNGALDHDIIAAQTKTASANCVGQRHCYEPHREMNIEV